MDKAILSDGVLDAVRTALEPALAEVGASFVRFRMLPGPIVSGRMATTAMQADSRRLGSRAALLFATIRGWSRHHAETDLPCLAVVDRDGDPDAVAAQAMGHFAVEIHRQRRFRDEAAAIGLDAPIPPTSSGRIDHLEIDPDAFAAISSRLGPVDALAWLSRQMTLLHDKDRLHHLPGDHTERTCVSSRGRRLDVRLSLPTLAPLALGTRPYPEDLWFGNVVTLRVVPPTIILDTLPGRTVEDVVSGLPIGRRRIAEARLITKDEGLQCDIPCGLLLELEDAPGVRLADLLDRHGSVPGARG